MPTLVDLFRNLLDAFPGSEKGQERARLFAYTLLAIILPVGSARTSNLLRTLECVYAMRVSVHRYYTFMASPRLNWGVLWERVWKAIPKPLEGSRLLVALDDSLNPKTGKKIFACHRFFDHAAKPNGSRYPWSQNIVNVGLLKRIKGRWACIPLTFRFYHLKKDIGQRSLRVGRRPVAFETKLAQAADMIEEVARVFSSATILVVADSWFGNRGLLKPMREAIGERTHLLSRLRSNAALYAEPASRCKGPGRPAKYGLRLGTVTDLACQMKARAKTYTVDTYGRVRDVWAHDEILLVKNLRCRVRVVWIYRRTQWVALFTTDLDLSVPQIIEYYAARWKIEAGFKELKQDVGSTKSQCRTPQAVVNHLQFCMMAVALTWIHTEMVDEAPERRHSVKGRRHFAFSDARRQLMRVAADSNFDTVFGEWRSHARNSVAAMFMRLVA